MLGVYGIFPAIVRYVESVAWDICCSGPQARYANVQSDLLLKYQALPTFIVTIFTFHTGGAWNEPRSWGSKGMIEPAMKSYCNYHI